MRLLPALLLVPTILRAQDFDFYGRGPYRTEVPRPDTLLGYRVGSQQTMYSPAAAGAGPHDRGGTRSGADRGDRDARPKGN